MGGEAEQKNSRTIRISRRNRSRGHWTSRRPIIFEKRNEGRKKGREGERWRAEQRGFFTGFSPRFFFSAGARATRPFYKFTPVHRSFSAELSRSNALPARGVGCAFLQAFVPGLSCVCRIHRSFVRSLEKFYKIPSSTNFHFVSIKREKRHNPLRSSHFPLEHTLLELRSSENEITLYRHRFTFGTPCTYPAVRRKEESGGPSGWHE